LSRSTSSSIPAAFPSCAWWSFSRPARRASWAKTGASRSAIRETSRFSRSTGRGPTRSSEAPANRATPPSTGGSSKGVPSPRLWPANSTTRSDGRFPPRAFRDPLLRRRRRARAVGAAEVRGAEETAGRSRVGSGSSGNLRRTWSLACCDSLHPERVSSRPSHPVLHFAVGADGLALDLLSETGGSHDPHSALTVFATNDFLHTPSSRVGLLGRSFPPDL